MLWLTVIAIAIMGAVKNEIAAIVLSAILLVAVLIILYRNMSLLSVGVNSTGNTRSMKIVIVFDIVLVVFWRYLESSSEPIRSIWPIIKKHCLLQLLLQSLSFLLE